MHWRALLFIQDCVQGLRDARELHRDALEGDDPRRMARTELLVTQWEWELDDAYRSEEWRFRIVASIDKRELAYVTERQTQALVRATWSLVLVTAALILATVVAALIVKP